MRVCLAQVNPCVGDLEGNVECCLRAVGSATDGGAELVVLPELAIPGCHPRDILCDPSFVEAVGEATADLAARTRGAPPVVVGTVIPAMSPYPGHPGLYNVAAVLQDGAVLTTVARQRLPTNDVHLEPRWFLPGPATTPLEVAGRRVAIRVGEPADPWDGDADLLVTISASHYRPGVLAQRLRSNRSAGLPHVLVNLVGGNDELIFDGRSFACNAEGRLVASLAPFREETRVIDLETAEPIVPEPSGSGWQEEVFAALVLGTRDFAAKNRIGVGRTQAFDRAGVARTQAFDRDQLFLGLSGGIDSALTAVIAAEAVGAQRVTGVAMPSRHTDPRSTEWARRHAADLGIGFEEVELEPLHSAAEASLAALLDEGTAAENVQARLRALILMAFVNHHGGLLLCTSNKTELALGYGTLYGDLAGALCPIADLTKLQVMDLSRWLHDNRGIIPTEILNRAPTAELRPDQVDPFDYTTVAPAMEALILADQSDAYMRRSEHKRRQSGVILKVSPRSFGPGRLIPITRR